MAATRETGNKGRTRAPSGDAPQTPVTSFALKQAFWLALKACHQKAPQRLIAATGHSARDGDCFDQQKPSNQRLSAPRRGRSPLVARSDRAPCASSQTSLQILSSLGRRYREDNASVLALALTTYRVSRVRGGCAASSKSGKSVSSGGYYKGGV